jgi:hypothetical protein
MKIGSIGAETERKSFDKEWLWDGSSAHMSACM